MLKFIAHINGKIAKCIGQKATKPNQPLTSFTSHLYVNVLSVKTAPKYPIKVNLGIIFLLKYKLLSSASESALV